MKMNNNSGFSLPEILIGVGIMGAVALGSVQLFKSQNDVKKSVDRHQDIQTIQKLIESKLYTEEGCQSVKGLSVGSSITLKVGSSTYSSGEKIGKNQINNFQITEFIPYDESGSSGIAKINLSIRGEDGKNAIIQLPLAVNMADSSIESCNTSLQKITDDLFQNICGGSFGTLSSGKTCSQVLAELQDVISKSICDDVFGGTGQMSGKNCNLSVAHANKLCGSSSAATGFDGQGKIVCKPVKTSTTTPPPASVCTGWSTWGPSTSGTCTTSTVTQTRSCTSGKSETQTQTVNGTKICSTECTSWGDWSPGLDTTCTDKTVNQTRTCKAGNSEIETRSIAGTKKCEECTISHPYKWNMTIKSGTRSADCQCSEYYTGGGTSGTSKLPVGESVELNALYCSTNWDGYYKVTGNGKITLQCISGGYLKVVTKSCY